MPQQDTYSTYHVHKMVNEVGEQGVQTQAGDWSLQMQVIERAYSYTRPGAELLDGKILLRHRQHDDRWGITVEQRAQQRGVVSGALIHCNHHDNARSETANSGHERAIFPVCKLQGHGAAQPPPHITFRDIRLADDNTHTLVEDCRIHRTSLTVRYSPFGAITYVVPDTASFRQPRTVYIRGYLMVSRGGG